LRRAPWPPEPPSRAAGPPPPRARVGGRSARVTGTPGDIRKASKTIDDRGQSVTRRTRPRSQAWGHQAVRTRGGRWFDPRYRRVRAAFPSAKRSWSAGRVEDPQTQAHSINESRDRACFENVRYRRGVCWRTSVRRTGRAVAWATVAGSGTVYCASAIWPRLVRRTNVEKDSRPLTVLPLQYLLAVRPMQVSTSRSGI